MFARWQLAAVLVVALVLGGVLLRYQGVMAEREREALRDAADYRDTTRRINDAANYPTDPDSVLDRLRKLAGPN